MPYEFTDAQDVHYCRDYMIQKQGEHEAVPPVEYLMKVLGLNLDTPREEIREVWDQFIQLMISPRIDEEQTRRRYPWGVWRLEREGRIEGAPSLFDGTVHRDAGGFYQIHQYPCIPEEEVRDGEE